MTAFTTTSRMPANSNRMVFESVLAQQTGLDPRVIHAWVSAESGNERYTSAPSGNDQNWLNIGWFDSGRGGLSRSQVFQDPRVSAHYTADFLKGTWGGASTGIRNILRTAGQSAQEQITAIGNSGWATNPQYGKNILSLFTHPGPFVAPDPNSLGSILNQIGGAASDTASTVASPFTSAAQALSFLFSKQFFYIVGGGILFVVALIIFAGSSKPAAVIEGVASKVPIK